MELPKFQVVREVISSLERLDLKSADSSLIEQKLRMLMVGHARQCLDLNPDQIIYRGRVTEDLIAQSSEIGARDHIATENFQRANYPGRSMFYGSADVGAMLVEIEPTIGQHVLISKWKPTSTTNLNQVGFNFKLLEQMGISTAKSPFRSGLMPQTLDHPAIRLVDEFIAKQFIKKITEPYEYKITAAIANALMDFESAPEQPNRARIDGIIYPSFASRFLTVNLALRKSLADSLLQLIAIEQFRIEDILESGEYVLITTKVADVDRQGGITWSPDLTTSSVMPSELKFERPKI
jgi:hypothetical protein